MKISWAKIKRLFRRKKSELKQFEIPAPFLSIQQEAAKFIFDRAETFLKQVIEIEELLTERSYKLLSVLIPIFLVVFGYGARAIAKGDSNLWLVILSSFSSAFLFVTILVIYAMLFPKNILINGKQPFAAMRSEDFLKNKDQYRAYLLDEIKILQMKIATNLKEYKRRLYNFKLALRLIIAMLVVDLLVVILALFQSI